MVSIKVNGKTFWDRIQPRDIIALAVIGGCFILKFTGANGMVSMVMASVIGYYFSKRVYEEQNRK